MDKSRTYKITVRNGVDKNAMNATSPIKVRVAQVELQTALLTAHTDQSGLIGMLRYLHQQGYVLLSIIRE